MSRKASPTTKIGFLLDFLDLIPDLMSVTNSNGDVIAFNSSWRTLGFSFEEMQGRSIFEFIHPTDQEIAKTGFERAVASGRAQSFESRWLMKDGSSRWLCWNSQYDASTGLISSSCRDCTDTKRERHLCEQTTCIAGVGGWRYDIFEDKITWTAETYRIHEVSPTSFTPTLQIALNFFAPESHRKATDLVQRGIEKGQPWDAELELITAKEKRIWVRTIGAPELTQNRVTALYGTIQDISEIRIKQREIESTREKLDLALRSANMGIWEWDIANDKLYWSEQTYHIAGVNPQTFKLSYETFLSVIYEEDRARVAHSLEVGMKTMRDYELTTRLRWPDGSLHTTCSIGRVYRDLEGKPIRMIGTVWNIDALKLAEKQRALLAEAEQNIRSRDEFIEVISHELRTPLTPIASQVQLIGKLLETGDLQKLSYETVRNLFQGLDNSIKRIRELVESLLNLSQISLGKMVLQKENVDLFEVIQELVRSFERNIVNSRCTVSIENLAEVFGPVYAYCDRKLIKKAIAELLVNALKFAPGSRVVISLMPVNETVEIQIKDSGPGINHEKQQRIFGKFERGVSPHHYGGLGIGLYVADQIARSHHGSLQLTSLPGKGSTFVLSIPRKIEKRLKRVA